jgi:hypothetical protein
MAIAAGLEGFRAIASSDIPTGPSVWYPNNMWMPIWGTVRHVLLCLADNDTLLLNLALWELKYSSSRAQ